MSLAFPHQKTILTVAMSARVYWEEKNLQKIATYCQKDVLTVAQLLLRFKGEPLINTDSIIITA